LQPVHPQAHLDMTKQHLHALPSNCTGTIQPGTVAASDPSTTAAGNWGSSHTNATSGAAVSSPANRATPGTRSQAAGQQGASQGQSPPLDPKLAVDPQVRITPLPASAIPTPQPAPQPDPKLAANPVVVLPKITPLLTNIPAVPPAPPPPPPPPAPTPISRRLRPRQPKT
jgi:hypothetical protein